GAAHWFRARHVCRPLGCPALSVTAIGRLMIIGFGAIRLTFHLAIVVARVARPCPHDGAHRVRSSTPTLGQLGSFGADEQGPIPTALTRSQRRRVPPDVCRDTTALLE